MSIELLERMAAQRLPIDCIDDEQRDGLLVLRSAGLIAALLLRMPHTAQPPGAIVVRVLAITSDGRRLLQRARVTAGEVAAGAQSLAVRSG